MGKQEMQSHSSTGRQGVRRRRRKRPYEISSRGRRSFNAFVHQANRDLLHPLDWERYYEFILVCHLMRDAITPEELDTVLRLLFPAHIAERLAIVYDSGRELLQFAMPVYRRHRAFWHDDFYGSEPPDYWESAQHQAKEDVR